MKGRLWEKWLSVIGTAIFAVLLAFTVAGGVEAREIPSLNGQGLDHGKYAGVGKHYGVDVSVYQGEIDWKEARKQGVEFAFIQLGYRGYSKGSLATDRMALKNLRNAKTNGVKIGAYFFSQAINTSEAVEEADYSIHFLQQNGITLDLPLAMDYEFAGGNDGRLTQANLSKEAATQNALAFCAEVQRAGFRGCVYANPTFLRNHMNADQITSNGYLTWLASYNNRSGYSGDYKFWQYSSRMEVSFDNSQYIDVDVWYDDGSAVGYSNPNSLNLFNGVWYKYTNGNIDWGYNGLQDYNGSRFWITNGQVNWNYNGLALNPADNVWYYVHNGAVDTNYNSLVYFAPNNTWFYVHDGYLHWNDNTLVCYNNAWFKVTNSAVDWGYNGLQYYNGSQFWITNGMVNWGANSLELNPGDNTWYYVQGGIVNTAYNSLVYFAPNNTWFYVHDGYLHWNDNTLVCYNNAWFKVTNSAVDWGYTGAQSYNGDQFYVDHGIVNWGYTGIGLNALDNVWYYFTGGIINRGYNSLVYFAPNNTWFYVHDGYLHWNDNTLVCYNNAWFKVTNSAVDWGYNGLQYYNGSQFWITNGMVNWGANSLELNPGDNTWYYVQGGIVNTAYNSLVYFAPNNTWFYVHDGYLHWNDNTLVLYNNTWFKVTNSAVDWNYHGLQDYNGSKFWVDNGTVNWRKNGTNLNPEDNKIYMMSNGIVNQGYTGLATYNNVWYYFTNGVNDTGYDGFAYYNGSYFRIDDGKLNWSFSGVGRLNNKRVSVMNGIVKGDYASQTASSSSLNRDASVVFVGDSYGTGFTSDNAEPIGPDFSWAGQITSDYGLTQTLNASYNAIGFARSADQQTFQSRIDWAATQTDAASVRYVIIAGGYNDMGFTYSDIMEKGSAAIQRAKELFPNATIFLGMPSYNQWRTDFQSQITNTVLPAYKTIASQTGVVWIDDLEKTLSSHTDTICDTDGMHPNVNGDHYLALTIEECLNKHMNDAPTAPVRQAAKYNVSANMLETNDFTKETENSSIEQNEYSVDANNKKQSQTDSSQEEPHEQKKQVTDED